MWMHMDVLQYNVQVCMHSAHPLFPLSTARCSATHFDFLGCSSPWIAAFNVYSRRLDGMRNNEKHSSRNIQEWLNMIKSTKQSLPVDKKKHQQLSLVLWRGLFCSLTLLWPECHLIVCLHQIAFNSGHACWLTWLEENQNSHCSKTQAPF